MQADIQLYIERLWIVVGVVWLVGALVTKPTARTQGPGSRFGHLVLTAFAFALLFSSKFRVGPLAWRFLPNSAAIAWTGFGIAAVGCAFAIWARFLLGTNWSATVTLKQEHELVRRGPYAIVRHPIYSGGLVGLFGTAIAEGELRGLLGVALAFVAWRMKSQLEESFLKDQFGAEYLRYQQQVKALIPFVL